MIKLVIFELMDMNKYLLVAFYVVAGCSVITPAEGLNLANDSHQIWVELNSILDENEVFLQDLSDEQVDASSIRVLKSRVSRILLSSLYALKVVNEYSFSHIHDDGYNIACYLEPSVLNISNTSIQIRAPEFN